MYIVKTKNLNYTNPQKDAKHKTKTLYTTKYNKIVILIRDVIVNIIYNGKAGPSRVI